MYQGKKTWAKGGKIIQEITVLSKLRKRKTNPCAIHLYVDRTQMNTSMEQKQTHGYTENTVVAEGVGWGKDWDSGLVDANYYYYI